MPSGNYSFVIDSSFQPFTFQELLAPMLVYKDAYDKAEEAYNELNDKAGDFEYLSKTLPEGSKARAIYEGYANDLKTQSLDLATNGLLLRNKSGLAQLKRRYKGEIGRLVKADEAMQEVKKLRRAKLEQDSSMLYALDNFSVDDFLDGNEPNLYGISGTELYTRGKEIGRSNSSRIFSSKDLGPILGGYFRDYVEKSGYDPNAILEFRKKMASIPELQLAAKALLEERGVTANLKGNPAALERAKLSVLNGIIDGIVYTEKHNPVRDPGVMSAKERSDVAISQANLALKQKELAFNMSQARASNKGAKVIGLKQGGKDGKLIEQKLKNETVEIWPGGDVKPLIKTQNKSYGIPVSYKSLKSEPERQKQVARYLRMTEGIDNYYNLYKGKNGQIVIQRNNNPGPALWQDKNGAVYDLQNRLVWPTNYTPTSAGYGGTSGVEAARTDAQPDSSDYANVGWAGEQLIQLPSSIILNDSTHHNI